jgi:hypothetical protein
MKKILFSLFLIAIAIGNQSAFAQKENKKNAGLKRYCPRVVDVGGASDTIYKQSAPLRAGGIGTAIIGYRKEPTLIMNRNISVRGTRNIYDIKGNKLGSCPWTDAHGHSGGRYRCTMQTSSLRRSAVGNTRSATVYFSVTNKMCVRVPDAGRCYGSVKGLCNQLIS